MVELNQEKQKIIDETGNILVTANPGTGKTLLLAHKYVKLLDEGIKPSEILCLTFTKKAKKEMEDRIVKLIEEKKIKLDFSELNVHTFHSYANENILEEDIISSNMLRYVIYDYLRKNEILTYSDNYIVGTIVPKLENLLRYIKTYGILPEDINIEETKKFLQETNSMSKEEMDAFAEELLKIYKEYEKAKEGVGMDYSDLLIRYLKLPNKKKFKYVLVDELQDVNELEAEIALVSAENFIAVGDKKQAIFGFQGGSIENFRKFKDSKKFVLSENFRSTNEILNYAKAQFESSTDNEEYNEDLEGLRNAENKTGSKPIVYEYDENEKYWNAVCTLAEQIINKNKKENKKVAILTRTNYQITDIAKELKNRGVDFEVTINSASDKAKENIIKYIKGVLSNDADDVKQAIFTPFSPVELRKAFEITRERKPTLEYIEEKAPEMKKVRDKIKNINDLNKLFTEKIIPVSVSCGQGYLLAASTLLASYQEFMQTIKDTSLHNLVIYLNSTDMLADDFNSEGDIILSTVHKAKGREFDTVIYVPLKSKSKTGFWDKIGEAILQTKGINAEEELEGEDARINFVGITRAEKELYVISEEHSEYVNDFAEVQLLDVSKTASEDTQQRIKKAFSLFVNKEYEKAKELLESKGEKWLYNTVKNHFNSMEHISFSSAKSKPSEYLIYKILNLGERTKALTIGSNVHKLAERIMRNEEIEIETEEIKEYKENILNLLNEIKKDYPEIVGIEEKINVKISEITENIKENILFNGFIDAIFKNSNDEYLIVDWKTSRRKDKSTEHRRQLGLYKKAFASKHNIPLEKIKVSVGYVGLKKRVNISGSWAELYDNPPNKQLLDTFEKRVKKILEWKNNPKNFFKDLEEETKKDRNLKNNPLIQSIIEQHQYELK